MTAAILWGLWSARNGWARNPFGLRCSYSTRERAEDAAQRDLGPGWVARVMDGGSGEDTDIERLREMLGNLAEHDAREGSACLPTRLEVREPRVEDTTGIPRESECVVDVRRDRSSEWTRFVFDASGSLIDMYTHDLDLD